MKALDLANQLNGCIYRKEVDENIETIAKENNLVIVFGASDDILEFRGAIDDEAGLTAYIYNKELLQNKCSAYECPYYENVMVPASRKFQREFDHDEGYWMIDTDVPHFSFMVYEDDERTQKYGQGIVFNLKLL